MSATTPLNAPHAWHDTPPCPACKADDGTDGAVVTREHHVNGESYPADVTLICVPCGHGFVGTPEEVAKAAAADAAWDAFPF